MSHMVTASRTGPGSPFQALVRGGRVAGLNMGGKGADPPTQAQTQTWDPLCRVGLAPTNPKEAQEWKGSLILLHSTRRGTEERIF